MNEIKMRQAMPLNVEVAGPISLYDSWDKINMIRYRFDGVWERSEEQMGHAPHYFKVTTLRGLESVIDGRYLVRFPNGVIHIFDPETMAILFWE